MPPKAAPAKKAQPSKSPDAKKDDKGKKDDPKAKKDDKNKDKGKQAPKPESPKKEEPPPPPPSPPKPEPEQQEEDPYAGPDEATRRRKQADAFKKYLQQTGIAMAFQIVFAQILDKKIQEAKVFQYAAMRLRQIGEDLQKIKLSKK